MTLQEIVIFILVGALIGWLAGLFMKSHHGFWMNCLLGIVGSALGQFIAGLIGLVGGTITLLSVDVVGACLVIALARLLFGRRRCRLMDCQRSSCR